MPTYGKVAVDPDFHDRVVGLMLRYPGLWPSARQLYHDLLRRGLFSLEHELIVHASDPVAPSAPVPAASPRTRTGGGERRGAQRASTAERGRRRAGKDRSRGDPPGR